MPKLLLLQYKERIIQHNFDLLLAKCAHMIVNYLSSCPLKWQLSTS